MQYTDIIFIYILVLAYAVCEQKQKTRLDRNGKDHDDYVKPTKLQQLIKERLKKLRKYSKANDYSLVNYVTPKNMEQKVMEQLKKQRRSKKGDDYITLFDYGTPRNIDQIIKEQLEKQKINDKNLLKVHLDNKSDYHDKVETKFMKMKETKDKLENKLKQFSGAVRSLNKEKDKLETKSNQYKYKSI